MPAQLFGRVKKMRTWTLASIVGAVFAVATLPALPSIAQTDNNKKNENKTNENKTNDNNAGPLQPPKPYGDRGTKTLGNPPIQYPTKPNPNKNPLEYWK